MENKNPLQKLEIIQEFEYTDDSGYLHELCINSRLLYDKTIEYLSRIETNDKRYESVYHVIKEYTEYKLLKAQSSQQVIKLACTSFESYYKALKEFYNNPKQY